MMAISILNDLFRRDFTVNAIAIKISNMEMIDTHNGESSGS